MVRRLLCERRDNRRMAVIVNEFGDVGIDGAILEGGNIDMIELTSGCLCCTLKPNLNSEPKNGSLRVGAGRQGVDMMEHVDTIRGFAGSPFGSARDG